MGISFRRTDAQASIKCKQEQLDAWKEAARQRGLTFTSWAIRTLNDAAQGEQGAPQPYAIDTKPVTAAPPSPTPSLDEMLRPMTMAELFGSPVRPISPPARTAMVESFPEVTEGGLIIEQAGGYSEVSNRKRLITRRTDLQPPAPKMEQDW